MPIDLAHNLFFITHELRVSDRFSTDAGFYQSIKKFSFPETAIKSIANL